MASANGSGAIRYTLNGSEPTETSALYSGPIRLTKTATIRARTYWGEGKSSDVAEAEFVRDE